MNLRAAGKYFILFTLLVMIAILFTFDSNYVRTALAQVTNGDQYSDQVRETPAVEVISPYFSIEQATLPDGTPVSRYIINGPSAPLSKDFIAGTSSFAPSTVAGIIPNFPSYSWVFGCSAVSGAMISAYYDRGAYPNLYTGPTNGGVMPLTDTSWPLWSDGYDPYPNNPLVASHNGVDGRAVKGSIDDYWVQYLSEANDPYITGGWQQHTWSDAIGDYMKTSQSAFENVDGSTSFYNYTSSSAKLTCSFMEANDIDDLDGTYGRKLFYEARGYSVGECYNQRTDNAISGGFSLLNYKAEIDAGNPVMLNLAGHTIVGYGYEGTTVYLRNTWDNDPTNTYTMTWGTSYDGMQLLSVSIVHLAPQAASKSIFMPLIKRAVPANQSPTNIQLSNSTIMENLPPNTLVGNLSSTDPNVGDTFTYSLVSGAGDTGNSSFIISTNHLYSAVVFDYESQNSYSIRLRSTDQGGLYFEKVFTISILPLLDPIVNGNFEQGHVAWTEYSSIGYALITQVFPGGVAPHDGAWAVWLGGDYYETSYIQQSFQIPAGLTYLSYWRWIASQDACGWDFGRVLINGSPVEEFSLCSDNNTGGWVQSVINLSVFAGYTVTLQIKAECDGSLNSNLFIDQVSLQSAPLGSTIPALASPDLGASATKPETISK